VAPASVADSHRRLWLHGHSDCSEHLWEGAYRRFRTGIALARNDRMVTPRSFKTKRGSMERVAVRRVATRTASFIILVGAVACDTPTRPSVSVSAAKAVLPGDGTVIAATNQPVTLTAQNAVTTSSGPVTDTFEVATDQGFGKIVLTKSVSQSAGTQTSITLDPLAPATYYWRVRTSAGGAAVASATGTFRIAAVLLAPVPGLPANGVLIGNLNQPVTLSAQNPPPSPTVNSVTDTFDVATDGAFAHVVTSTAVPQSAGTQTSLTLNRLQAATLYYWRVRAAADGAIGAVSATASFMIGPAIMSGPYRLLIDGTASVCRNPYYVGNSNIFHYVYEFDSDLTLSDQTLLFTKPAVPFDFGPDLTLRLALVGNRVSGSLGGSSMTTNMPKTNLGEPLEVFVSRVINGLRMTPVDTSGSVNDDASIAGSFDGYIGVYVPHLDGDTCLATFTWTLAPH
jgi:hypothetical protein